MNMKESQVRSPLPRRIEHMLTTLVGQFPVVSLLNTRLRNLFYRPLFARMGTSVRIKPGVEFLGAHCIELGDNVNIDSGACIDGEGSNNRICLENGVRLGFGVRIKSAGSNSRIYLGKRVSLDPGVNIKAHDHGCIEIGERTYLGPHTCLAGPGQIRIGRDCLIASLSSIYANNHKFSDLTRLIRQQGVTFDGIVIEDDCWLGSGVRVLDGVTIGRGSVIGAGAVVTKDIPAYSVAVGVPAKVISIRNQAEIALAKT